jgi:hypothetical protein
VDRCLAFEEFAAGLQQRHPPDLGDAAHAEQRAPFDGRIERHAMKFQLPDWIVEDVDTEDRVVETLNARGWNITVEHVDGAWFVSTGDQRVMTTPDRTVVSGFLVGLLVASALIAQ